MKPRLDSSVSLRMSHALTEEGNDAVILHPVVDFLAIPARVDQPHLTQSAQVVRNSGLADAYKSGQSTNVEVPLGQRRQEPDPAGIAEGAEELRHVGGGMFVENGGGGGSLVHCICEYIFMY